MRQRRCRYCDRRIRRFPGLVIVVGMVIVAVILRIIDLLSDVEQQMHSHRTDNRS